MSVLIRVFHSNNSPNKTHTCYYLHSMMLEFNKDGQVVQDFKGKALIAGETDGSSFPNGGLRGTHEAGGYLAIDTSSPIFLRGDTIFIPSVFTSYHGDALDEKIPLLRANTALDKNGTRLLKHLGLNPSGVHTNIGLEQEIFLVPREQYYRRPDLQFAGRTVIGASPARGQEMSDHYMAPLSAATAVMACMQEIQDECWRMGIPLRTRHREVAPNQFEFAPLYGINTTQIDQNIMTMQIIEEVAAKHGLAALLQEKPFAGINGSGKHNNWSIATREGVNILDPVKLNEATGNTMAFPVVMAALVAAVDEHGDLMRAAIASPGNEFRLGGFEAPPAIVSAYLGADMTKYLEAFMNGEDAKYEPRIKTIDLGAREVTPFTVPAQDRNRTSTFPYGGGRFEFRAVGSSQNVSFVNTVLNTMAAEKFGEFADRADAGEDLIEIAKEELKKHFKVVFNGDGYDPENQKMLTDRGVWRIDSGVDAIARLTADKNIKFFEGQGVLSAAELKSRQDIFHEHYVGTIEMEALALRVMLNKNVIPSMKAAGFGPLAELETFPDKIKEELAKIHEIEDPYKKATAAHELRMGTMEEMRKVIDAAEEICPEELWTLATYKELLFMDSHSSTNAQATDFDEM